MKKSVMFVKAVLFIVGLFLFIHSGVLNELNLHFNETESLIGLVLILLSLFRFIRTTIKSLI